MGAHLVGYARVSTRDQDLSVQIAALERLGVPPENIYTDHGLTGTNRSRPGLEKAMAACRAGDTLCVVKLDRLARSLRDACDIVDELTRKTVVLNIGGTRHDPMDPMGRLLLNVLAMVAEFEADLIRQRTREGMAMARDRGRLQGKKPKLPAAREKQLVRMHGSGEHTVEDLCDIFGVTRSTVYRAVERAKGTDVHVAAVGE